MSNTFVAHSHIQFKDKNGLVCAFLYENYSISPHYHEFYEMNIVFSGKGTHKINQSKINVKSGDVFVIPPFTTHTYYDTDNLDVYHILLHKDFILQNKTQSDKVPGFLQLTEIEPYLRQNNDHSVFLHLNAEQLLQIKKELIFIEDNGIFDTKEYIPIKYHTTWKILYWLSYLLNEQNHSDVKTSYGKYNQTIINSLEYIHKNYGEKITIKTLCENAYLSRSTFLRYFNEICNENPIRYLNNYRCKRAIEIMDNTNCSKTETALLCGFYDLSHMEKSLNKYLKNQKQKPD